jgi:hypothetical protein
MGIPIGLLLALARNEWPSVLSVLRLSLRLNRRVIVKSDTALAATNDDKFASLTDIEVAQNGIESRRMESLECLPCDRCDGYFSEYFMNPVNIDNCVFVAVCQKPQAGNGEHAFPDREVI